MKDKKQIMLDELSKEPEMVTATAYLYAKNFVRYGEDITKAWTTAVQQEAILRKAYNDGYSDALKEREEHKVGKWIEVWESQRDEFSGEYDEWREHKCSICDFQEMDADRFNFCPNCGAEMRGSENG